MSTFSLTTAQNLFKINYYKKSENMYNSANVLLGRIKKKYDFTGRQRFVATPLSFSGGVGSGTLPTAGVATYSDALILSKKVYAVCQIDRESIKASSDDKGAFVRATKETVQKCVESYMRNASRILFGNGDGSLGTGDAAEADTPVLGTGGSGDPYIVAMAASTFKEANWEENDIVNLDAETTALTVVAVVPATSTVHFEGSSVLLADDAAAVANSTSEIFYMQGSKDNDPQGLKGVLDATSGTLYNISVARRWQSTRVDGSASNVTEDKMNEVMLSVERKFGKAPNLIVCSYAQYRKIMLLFESLKRYSISPRDKQLKGKVSFSGLEFMSTRGPIGIFPERFCEDDRIYFLNDNFIECHHRPGFGWFDDDGTVFLRKDGIDEYEARYGGYLQNYITPSAHGVLYNLTS